MNWDGKPRIIAEIGANHMGDLDLARAMIDAAAESGCDTVKFQSWQPEKLIAAFPDYDATYARHARHRLTDEGHVELIEYCRGKGIRFLTSCFDIDRIEFLADLGLDEIKVASPDCGSLRLIHKLMDHFPRLIISTGMSEDAVVERTIRETGGHDVVFLHCVSLYPTPIEQVNMERMNWLRDLGVRVGFSDHSLGTEAAKLAISWGAEVVEKHFTLSRLLPGKDQSISAEPEAFQDIALWAEQIAVMRGTRNPELSEEEQRLASIYVGKWGDNA